MNNKPPSFERNQRRVEREREREIDDRKLSQELSQRQNEILAQRERENNERLDREEQERRHRDHYQPPPPPQNNTASILLHQAVNSRLSGVTHSPGGLLANHVGTPTISPVLVYTTGRMAEPIIYEPSEISLRNDPSLTGTKPDTLFQIFKQPFHVHSRILRQHSWSYNEELKSADQNLSKNIEVASFRYKYGTIVNRKRFWKTVLEGSEEQNESVKQPNVPINGEDAIRLFTNYLNALYDKPVQLFFASDVYALVLFAKKTGALPMVSKAVKAVSGVFDDPRFLQEIPHRCLQLLETAVGLRDEVLFRECIIYATASHDKPDFYTLEDPVLKEVARKAYQGIIDKVANLQRRRSHYGKNLSLFQKIDRQLSEEGVKGLPMIYRAIQQRFWHELPDEFKTRLEALLNSKLQLDRRGVKSGEGLFQGCFLCAEVSDDDLPWKGKAWSTDDSSLAVTQPDTSLQLFDMKYHAHSDILRQHSRHFREYLDNIDRGPDQLADTFANRYRFVTDLNREKNLWRLIPAKFVNKEKGYSGDKNSSIQLFGTFLDALHGWSIHIPSTLSNFAVDYVCDLTSLAERKGALPRISEAIHSSSIFNHLHFRKSIRRNCVRLLDVTFKLRSELLFRECIIHATGPWKQPQYLTLKNAELHAVAQKAYQRLVERVLELGERFRSESHENVLAEAVRSKLTNEGVEEIYSEACDFNTMCMPTYFRNVQKYCAQMLSGEAKALLESLLASKLQLGHSRDKPGEPGIFQHTFLCAEVSDEDLPRDVSKRDW